MKFQGHREGLVRPTSGTQEAWTALQCGHCNREGMGAVLLLGEDHQQKIQWVQCPICGQGSVISTGQPEYQYPGVAPGPQIVGLPQDIEEAYDEARRCMSVSAFTASEGMCRKILMHVAVEKGAKAGEKFAVYISHLESRGFVTPTMKSWVDLIRKHGNESNHDLPSPSKDRAESTLMFTAELLRLTYEMDHMSKKYAPKIAPAKVAGKKT